MHKTVITVFLGLILVANTCAATMPSTDVRFYRPFEQKVEGQVGLLATEMLEGTCVKHSALDNRSDAWQCKSGNRVLDPCFIKSYVKTKKAICPISPWQSQATMIQLLPPLPVQNSNDQESLDMSEDDPWAINLVNGAHCVKLSNDNASVFVTHGQPVKYACDNHGFLLGHIQRCDLVWKMLFLPSRESANLNTVEISAAWY